jgi:hypothetical protein
VAIAGEAVENYGVGYGGFVIGLGDGDGRVAGVDLIFKCARGGAKSFHRAGGEQRESEDGENHVAPHRAPFGLKHA